MQAFVGDVTDDGAPGRVVWSKGRETDLQVG